MEFFATCGRGLEALLGDELRAIGVHGVRPLRAGVSFSGDMRDAYLACLWSRIASRVLMTVARVDAHSADSLYEDVRRIAWEDHIPLGKTIAFSARGTNANLRDTRFTALRAKDALCDRLRALRGERPDVDTVSPDVRISINVRNEKATRKPRGGDAHGGRLGPRRRSSRSGEPAVCERDARHRGGDDERAHRARHHARALGLRGNCRAQPRHVG